MANTRHITVIDVEATCYAEPERNTLNEIIEIGFCTLDTRTGAISTPRSVYVRPRLSRVTKFCTDLTGITNGFLDGTTIWYLGSFTANHAMDILRETHSAQNEPDAFHLIQPDVLWVCSYVYNSFRNSERTAYTLIKQGGRVMTFENITHALKEMPRVIPGCNRRIWASYGEYDRRMMDKSVVMGHATYDPPLYDEHLNVKTLYSLLRGCKPIGMMKALAREGIEPEGKHHTGRDDAYNTAKLLVKLVESEALRL